MALNLGTLAATLTIDDSDYKAKLRNAPRLAESAGRNIGGGVVRGMRPGLAKLGGLFAGLGIAKLTGDLLGFGLKTAMQNEKASISFTTMLGSAKKAQAFLAQMKDFAAKTPFEFPELQTAASSLISIGIKADKVIPIMRTLGDVTAGMGTGSEGVKRATVALQQMNAAGRITAEDLNQLRDAGIPVYDLLAAATGKSKKAVAELARTGGLGAKELGQLMKALETGKGLERFNGLMDKQSQSLEGIISTLKDTVGQGLADALAPLLPLIKDGITGFTQMLPPLISGAKAIGTWIVQNKDLLGYLAKAAGVLGIVTVAMWLLNAAMNANPIGLVVIAIGALVAGLLWAYDNVGWFRNAVNGAFTAIGAIFRWLWNNAIAPVLRFIVTGFGWVMDGFANMLDALGNVPGFEWARGAAVSMRVLAQRSREAADSIGDIPDPKVNTDNSQQEISNLNRKIQSIKGKIVEAKAKGDTKEVERLKTKLDNLRNKKVQVEANVKKTGISTIKLKDIPGGGGLRISAYASGGRFRPGWAMVGELGPELVRFNGSGQVYNHRQTASMLSGTSSSSLTQVQVDVHVAPGADPVSVGRAIEDVLVKYKKRTHTTRLAFT